MLRSAVDLRDLLVMPAREAAAFWLVRQDTIDDPHDDAIFQQWLEADSANGVAWAEACAAWEGFGATTDPEILDYREAANDTRPQRRWPLAVAASIALLIAACGTFFWLNQAQLHPGATEQPLIASKSDDTPAQRFASAAGTRRTVALPDGSQVILNTDTEIEVRFSTDRRDVKLTRGQAYFSVRHDLRRPFVVAAGASSITDIGTRFDVLSHNNALRVIVVEGKVRLLADRGGSTAPIDLKAGQQLDSTGSGLRVSQANLATATDWQRGIVTFQNTALAEAVSELNRYAAGKRLVVRDPEVASIRISGGFHTDDLGRFARSVADLHAVRVVETPTTVEIVARVPDRR